jgi:2,3-bisphosphoglycerate-independent phosphoglycerate mutase
MTSTRPKPLILCILDGWGEAPPDDHNAIARAATPHWDRLRREYPCGLLEASEAHVGLPAGQMGNSEVGHMNIGAGRIVLQDLPRIDAAIADGTIAKAPALQSFIAALKKSGGTCHLIGLTSNGGVHSHQSHIAALAQILVAAGITVRIHALLDGRDTPPKSAEGFLAQLQNECPAAAKIATVSGRYYAMDRDNRWERVAKAYATIVSAEGARFADAQTALTASYAAGITDEFMLPAVMGDYAGMKDGDGLLMANFRADRVRQLLAALLDPQFAEFPRQKSPHFAATLGMVEYSDKLRPLIPALFPPQVITEHFGAVIAEAGLTQLRIAETEKYAHVTFFFNGGEEAKMKGETRILIPSPKVATYDLQPEMSAPEVTAAILEAIANNQFDVIIVNYANTDMVGHSGDINAAMRAVEAVDSAIGQLARAVEAKGGAMIITADHGNAECLHDAEEDQPHTAHTLNPVPFLVMAPSFRNHPQALPRGRLCDIAPTLLALLQLPQPDIMTGHNLLEKR